MTLYVVAGAPCSGKSTLVREHAHPGDVVIDWDTLAQALGFPAEHGAQDWAAAPVVHAARTAALDAALTLAVDAWVIHTSPTTAQVQTYVQLGATIIVCDPGKPECIRRAHDTGRPTATRTAIGRWYGMPQPA